MKRKKKRKRREKGVEERGLWWVDSYTARQKKSTREIVEIGGRKSRIEYKAAGEIVTLLIAIETIDRECDIE